MKKLLVVLFGAMAIAACSSDDNSTPEVDPIFSQPFTALANLDELDAGRYAYVGNKIGDRNVGLLTSSNECKKKDYLFVHRTGVVLDSLSYNNYGMTIVDNKRDCGSIFDFPRIVRDMTLEEDGMLKAKITDDYIELEYVEVVNEEGEIIVKEVPVRVRKTPAHFDGRFEIGFQAGYLRVEDHLSNYAGPKTDKVYLYFKK